MRAVEQIHKFCRKEHDVGSSSCGLTLLSYIRMVGRGKRQLLVPRKLVLSPDSDICN